MNMKKLTLRIDETKLKEIDDRVEEQDFESRSDFVRQAIHYYLIATRFSASPAPALAEDNTG